jgi:hypothetical protein
VPAGRRAAPELPVDTVTFTVVRDDSGRIRVTLSPNRHLEAAPVEWPGPILDEDGQIPLGVEPNGRRIAIALFNDEGVEHALLAGTTGAGKTGTVAASPCPARRTGWRRCGSSTAGRAPPRRSCGAPATGTR